MRTVRVAAGIIQREDGRILAVQRGYGDMRGCWEFPGGKIEHGETAREACERELHEELGVTICDLRDCYTVAYEYDDFSLDMTCFLCRLADASPAPKAGDRQMDMRWLAPDELRGLTWMPADTELVDMLANAAAAEGSDSTEALIRRRAHIRRSMQGNKRADTAPELLVRQRLRQAGLTGYRLQWSKAPGRPDIAFPGRKIAIFVNGCFWHLCPHCNPSTPKRNTEFWQAKFQRNVDRDKQALADLREAGWTPIVIWECELKKKCVDETMNRVVEQIRAASAPSAQPQDPHT